MLPLGGEKRRSTQYSLTEAGRQVARQLVIRPESDAALRLLALLEERPRTIDQLTAKIPNARTLLTGLIKRAWVVTEEKEEDRDPMRASAERLEAEFFRRARRFDQTQERPSANFSLSSNCILARTILGELGEKVKKASESARSLAKRELIKLEVAGVRPPTGYERPRPELNVFQESAFHHIEKALQEGRIQNVSSARRNGFWQNRSLYAQYRSRSRSWQERLLLVPEIALTPAVAGQFFQRFGKQVAILHSAFGDAERADQWRRIQRGQARVVVGTRSGIFAPVQNLGLVIIDEEHDGSYKQQETPRYHGRDVALVRARNANAVAILVPPRPPSKLVTTPSKASMKCCACPSALPSARCRKLKLSTCASSSSKPNGKPPFRAA